MKTNKTEAITSSESNKEYSLWQLYELLEKETALLGAYNSYLDSLPDKYSGIIRSLIASKKGHQKLLQDIISDIDDIEPIDEIAMEFAVGIKDERDKER